MTKQVLSTLNALTAARSEIDFYKISIELQQFATPDDVKSLVDSAAIPPGRFRTWLMNLHEVVTLHERSPFVFERRDVATGISLYSGDIGSKTLIIGFCGLAQLLCTSLPVILQYFPPDAFDLLVLRSDDRQGFTEGIAGYSSSFPGLLEKLDHDLNFSQYQSVRCIGTSGGGAAALAAGVQLGASKFVCFSGRPPTSSSIYGKKPAALDLEARLKKSRVAKGQAFGVYGAGNSKDKNNALQLARLMEITLIPIHDLTDHVVIHPLHLRGELAGLFQKVGLI